MKYLIVLLVLVQVSLAHAGQCELIKLDEDFVGEQEFNKTIYVPVSERSNYEIKINSKGMILDRDGSPLDTRNLPNGIAMFVYSKEGKIYLSTRREGLVFDHSSLVGGEDVIVAGAIKVDRGYIDYVTDSSPMYQPKSTGNLKAAIYRLRVMGANTSKLRAFFQTNL